MRSNVVAAFKRIHRARLRVFAGDEHALQAARTRINDDFRRNAAVSDPQAIEQLVLFCDQCCDFMLKSVVQAKKTESGRFRLNILPETHKWENFPYNKDVDVKTLMKLGRKKCKDFVDKPPH